MYGVVPYVKMLPSKSKEYIGKTQKNRVTLHIKYHKLTTSIINYVVMLLDCAME